MSFYNPAASFSRPKVYDPSLAQHTQVEPSSELNIADLASRIAEQQRKSLLQELGLSDGEDDLCTDDEEAKEYSVDEAMSTVVREEFEQLQQRYMTALKEIHDMGEKERKAIEQVAKLRQMSKSQATILSRSYKAKLVEQASLLDELLSALRETEANAGLPPKSSTALQTAVEAHKAAITDAPSAQGALAGADLPAPISHVDPVVLQKQLDSVRHENQLLQQCLSDLISGEIPALVPRTMEAAAMRKVAQPESSSVDELDVEAKTGREPPQEATEDKAPPTPKGDKNAAFTSKLNNLSSDALKSKLVKALKVAKASQTKLAAAEAEKDQLLALLTEARTELESRSSAAAPAADAPPAPLAVAVVPPPTPLQDEPPAESKADKIREKFDKLKQKLAQSEAESAEAKAQAEALRIELQELRQRPAQAEIDTTPLTSRISALEESLVAEKRRASAYATQLSSAKSGLARAMHELKAQVAAQKALAERTKAELCEALRLAQRDVAGMVKSLEKRIAAKQEALSGVVAKYQREFKERKRLFNLVQELRGNIRVLCRVRPALDFEQNDVIVRIPEDGVVEVVNNKGRDKQWEFDHVFKSGTTNEQVFGQVADLCTSILDGYNVCIFAYGQTGSGKTHTMEGPENDPGVNFRALERLFENMSERNQGGEWTFEVQVSLLEIYNEQIRDLLADKNKQPKKLEVKAGKHGMHVPGLTMVGVTDHHQVIKLMQMGKRNRATACTDMNSHSSRSHSMLSTYIVARNSLTNEESRGKLHLIDLAGSERVSKSGVQGARLAEATNINKSLSALGDVIQARANKQGHVPYRNSTLTYLLQDSLSSDSKTLMFVQCSPVSTNASETTCSLNFAARARQVELGKAAKHVSK